MLFQQSDKKDRRGVEIEDKERVNEFDIALAQSSQNDLLFLYEIRYHGETSDLIRYSLQKNEKFLKFAREDLSDYGKLFSISQDDKDGIGIGY